MGKHEDVFDGRGKRLGRINHESDRDNYYDATGCFLGHTDASGTRDKIGRKIADKPVGGLLWKSES